MSSPENIFFETITPSTTPSTATYTSDILIGSTFGGMVAVIHKGESSSSLTARLEVQIDGVWIPRILAMNVNSIEYLALFPGRWRFEFAGENPATDHTVVIRRAH